MLDFHQDKATYFKFQYLTARDHILPFVTAVKPLHEIDTVLEIGCAEAGVLKAFAESGCRCLGIELSSQRIEMAKYMLGQDDYPGSVDFLHGDVTAFDPDRDIGYRFDLIILKDVIEHIPNQDRFIPMLRQFLNPGGMIFFGFPPWQMPFGGHQQICRSRVLSRLPYFHLLPKAIYASVLSTFGESAKRRDELLEIWDTRISIERFESILDRSHFRIQRRQFWLLNPIYRYKFGKGPVRQVPLLGKVPWLRNFITTAVYYVVKPE